MADLPLSLQSFTSLWGYVQYDNGTNVPLN